jgi:hypothetical protein
MSSPKPMQNAAFILSLIGGLAITIGSLISALLWIFGSTNGTFYGLGPAMMRGFNFYGYGWLIGFSIFSLACGVTVFVSALMLKVRPTEHNSLGIIILAFSIISFVGMGGYFIGAIVGLAGGALALSYK